MLLRKNDVRCENDPDIQLLKNLDAPTAIRVCLEYVEFLENLDTELEFTLTFYFID
jgi:hypothetical protein